MGRWKHRAQAWTLALGLLFGWNNRPTTPEKLSPVRKNEACPSCFCAGITLAWEGMGCRSLLQIKGMRGVGPLKPIGGGCLGAQHLQGTYCAWGTKQDGCTRFGRLPSVWQREHDLVYLNCETDLTEKYLGG